MFFVELTSLVHFRLSLTISLHLCSGKQPTCFRAPHQVKHLVQISAFGVNLPAGSLILPTELLAHQRLPAVNVCFTYLLHLPVCQLRSALAFDAALYSVYEQCPPTYLTRFPACSSTTLILSFQTVACERAHSTFHAYLLTCQNSWHQHRCWFLFPCKLWPANELILLTPTC